MEKKVIVQPTQSFGMKGLVIFCSCLVHEDYIKRKGGDCFSAL